MTLQSSSMPDTWRIHTLVFDLDDTLYPERDYVLSGFAAVDAWLRAQRGVEGFEAAARRIFESGGRGTIFNEALANVGVPQDRELIDQLIGVYRKHIPTLTLFPDAADTLQWCALAGLRLAIITDGYSEVQWAKIRALALLERITCCIVTDDLGGRSFWKPHQEAFRRVMTTHAGPESGYLYVADNPRKDFVAPRALGWHTVRIRRPQSEHGTFEAAAELDAEREISSLTQLQALIASS
jgi:putative hydrolase of the HAD superfamily